MSCAAGYLLGVPIVDWASARTAIYETGAIPFSLVSLARASLPPSLSLSLSLWSLFVRVCVDATSKSADLWQAGTGVEGSPATGPIPLMIVFLVLPLYAYMIV